MDYRNILGSSSKLRKASLYKTTIMDETRALLYQISSAIDAAHSAGLTTTCINLPINFTQLDDNVTNKEIQTSVYYNIINELERQGYEPALRFKLTSVKLTISWTVRADRFAIKTMEEKILAVTRN